MMTEVSVTRQFMDSDFAHAADTSVAVTGSGGLSADEALVLRVQLGDRSAFDVLAGKYRRRVMRVCRRYVHNSADAEDAVQITLMRAYQGLWRFRGDSEFYSWLHRIAINSAVTLASLQSRRESFLVNDMNGDALSSVRMQSSPDTPEGLAIADEIRSVVGDALAALCEDQRRALVLHELHGMSYSEVANTMGCPVGTVRSRVFRAREAVDARIRRVYAGGLGREKDQGRRVRLHPRDIR
jgi:RNA polymerase sigma-70 factor (ECF subfamily)